jgi:hypothetical protein
MGVGVLARKRRPNASAMYQLLMPLGGGLDWAAHIHHMTDTRQRKAHAKAKAERVAEATRTASTDVVENPGDNTPDSVRGFRTLPNRSGQRPWTPPDSVPGRLPDSVRGGGLPVHPYLR